MVAGPMLVRSYTIMQRGIVYRQSERQSALSDSIILVRYRNILTYLLTYLLN